ncbi:titin isoform x12 [Lasius niger]|uniref:Titin isoform x12 n=1 Tax=Lasius niger TaxID=67767 RepID=A0A0J7KZ60_LASNI|nr:titin isoform x12 [Lasius niger]
MSSIYDVYRDPKESIIERFPQDTPKYVALKDLFLSQDKDVTSTMNCEKPYESFYDFGFTADYSFIEGNNRENVTKDFDSIKERNYIGHELDTIYTKNKLDIDDLRLDIKLPLYNRDGMHNVKNGEYLKSETSWNMR